MPDIIDKLSVTHYLDCFISGCLQWGRDVYSGEVNGEKYQGTSNSYHLQRNISWTVVDCNSIKLS